MPFTFRTLDVPGVVLIEPKAFSDERGWFAETYKRTDYEKNGILGDFRQDNHSVSTRRGVLRGLHYQLPPMEQGKLVRCLVGEIWDVAVDIRRGSPTFGKWAAATLTAANRLQLYVPPGFAHGFVTLTDLAEVAYKTSNEYGPQHERTIRWNDPALAIEWPVREPLLHKRDAEAPLLADAENTFRWHP